MKNCNSKIKIPLLDRAFNYSLSVISLFDSVKRYDTATNVILKQLIRSSTSIGANIIEAQASSSRKDFTRFMTYSLKSSNESLYWLNLLDGSKRIQTPQIMALLKETDELSRILAASVLRLKGKR